MYSCLGLLIGLGRIILIRGELIVLGIHLKGL